MKCCQEVCKICVLNYVYIIKYRAECIDCGCSKTNEQIISDVEDIASAIEKIEYYLNSIGLR